MANRAVNQAVEIRILQEIEFKVIGNALGFMIACGGLLAGTMMTHRSTEYWLEDIVPLVLAIVMGIKLLRSLIAVVSAYQVAPNLALAHAHAQHQRESVQSDPAIMAQLAAPKGSKAYTAEEVMDAVAKRIEDQKAEAAKKNKFTN